LYNRIDLIFVPKDSMIGVTVNDTKWSNECIKGIKYKLKLSWILKHRINFGIYWYLNGVFRTQTVTVTVRWDQLCNVDVALESI